MLLAIVVVSYADRDSSSNPITIGGPMVVSGAKLSQRGPNLVLTLFTTGRWKTSQLAVSKNRFLCLGLQRKGSTASEKQICVYGKRGSDKVSLRVARLNKEGVPVSVPNSRIKASINRFDSRSIKAQFRPEQAGIRPGSYRWRIVSRWSGPKCKKAPTDRKICGDRFPRNNAARIDLRKVQLVGCKRRGASMSTNGPRNQKRVALTFDDGPSRYTPKILRILRKYGAKATFFVWGSQTTGRENMLNREMKDGHEIGNHSWNHHKLPKLKELRTTNKSLRRITGFKPCLFRPPYRVFDNKLISNVKRADMNMILWDVDPHDWRTPGSMAIANGILNNTQPGSIVLMHDGGGPRDQTVAALPRVLKKLRSRGYRFVTVSELLGYRDIWNIDKK